LNSFFFGFSGFIWAVELAVNFVPGGLFLASSIVLRMLNVPYKTE